jgi:nicotinamide riboside kinase
MEESVSKPSRGKRILITGPESTGKSELAIALSGNFHGKVIPEYARDYVGSLGRPYTFEDVEHIALHQAGSYEGAEQEKGWVFFDTWLIITKVWFDLVFGRVPDWIDRRIRESAFDLVLVCSTDLPWIPDPVRENGGERREMLLRRYQEELELYGYPWELVSGIGSARMECALRKIFEYLDHGAK